jgi:hypothetical protein
MQATIVLSSENAAKRLWAVLRNNWRAMADQGKPLAVTIAEHRSKRSNEQNRLYWATLNDIAAHAWVDGKQHSAEVWHEYFRRKFIGMEDLPGGGTCGISTTTLTVPEMAGYITRIQVYAAENFGIET